MALCFRYVQCPRAQLIRAGPFVCYSRVQREGLLFSGASFVIPQVSRLPHLLQMKFSWQLIRGVGCGSYNGKPAGFAKFTSSVDYYGVGEH